LQRAVSIFLTLLVLLAPVFSAATAAETQVTFPAAGDYVIYCRVSDGQLSAHRTISYRVLGEPFFAILTPQDGGVVSDNNVPEAQIRAFQEGGVVVRSGRS
jgi:hypothetical protein